MQKSDEYSKSSTAGKTNTTLLSYPLIFLVRLYQVTLSPLIGGSCRFHPTCSNYAIGALREHGPFKGLYLSVKRILRCHPWHAGGYDPVPEKNAE